MSSLRVSPPKVFPQATRSSKPPLDAAGSADAFRQTTFVLGDEVETVLDGLRIEASIAEASSGAKYRKQVTAAALGLWSRSWLTRLEALHAIEWGNYAAGVALVRSAADYQAAMLYLLRTDAAEWEEWLEAGGVQLAPDAHATEYRLHAFRAAEVLAAHEVLGPIYRTATDLSLTHFGSTLLIAGTESDPARIAVTFGDRDFHVALAEIHLGWLLELGASLLRDLTAFPAAIAVPASSPASWLATASKTASRPDRCRIETVERDGMKRYLVHHWRREPRSAARKLLL
jgi:hypothetical protein